MYDLIIRNGTIVDGTGAAGYKADIAIQGQKIVSIGTLDEESAAKVIDAQGKIVAPGFIDAHCHGDLNVFGDPVAKNQLLQGITTEVVGNCGLSFSPQSDAPDTMATSELDFLPEKERKKYVHPQSFPDFMDLVEKLRLGVNMVCYIGQGVVRSSVMGYRPGDASETELAEMKRIINEAMQAGAAGMSTGLIYPAGSLTGTEELIELAREVGKYGKRYVTHMRNEGDHIHEALEEAFRISKESGAELIVSHHKVCGINNIGRTVETLQMIDEEISNGANIYMDVYPYTAGATNFVSGTFPKEVASDRITMLQKLKDPNFRKWIHNVLVTGEGCGEPYLSAGTPDNVIIGSAPGCEETEGMNLTEAGAYFGCDPYEAALIVAEKTQCAAIASFNVTTEEDLKRVIAHPRAMFGTDASHSTIKNIFGHPRSWGTFPHIIYNYVKEESVISLEEFCRKASALPCEVLGIKGKGLIKEGYDADIVIFEYEKIHDTATYVNINGMNEGIQNVIVSGQIAVENDAITGVLAGSLIRL